MSRRWVQGNGWGGGFKGQITVSHRHCSQWSQPGLAQWWPYWYPSGYCQRWVALLCRSYYGTPTAETDEFMIVQAITLHRAHSRLAPACSLRKTRARPSGRCALRHTASSVRERHPRLLSPPKWCGHEAALRGHYGGEALGTSGMHRDRPFRAPRQALQAEQVIAAGDWCGRSSAQGRLHTRPHPLAMFGRCRAYAQSVREANRWPTQCRSPDSQT